MNLEDRCADLAVVAGQGWWSRKSVSSPQAARTPLVVDHGMMPRGLPTRRGLQTLALVIATAYATILLYQAVAPRQVIEAIVVIIVPYRARSDFFIFRCLRVTFNEVARIRLINTGIIFQLIQLFDFELSVVFLSVHINKKKIYIQHICD